VRKWLGDQLWKYWLLICDGLEMLVRKNLAINLDGTGLKNFLNYMCDHGGTSFKINKLKIQVSLLPALRRLVEMLLVSHNTSPNHTQLQ
jgi:hypothetical protein